MLWVVILSGRPGECKKLRPFLASILTLKQCSSQESPEHDFFIQKIVKKTHPLLAAHGASTLAPSALDPCPPPALQNPRYATGTGCGGALRFAYTRPIALLLCRPNYSACCVYRHDSLYRLCLETTERSSVSTQPCIPSGTVNRVRVPASAGVRAGISPLPGGS